MNSSFCGLDSSNGRALDYCLKGQGFDPGISPKCVFFIECLPSLKLTMDSDMELKIFSNI